MPKRSVCAEVGVNEGEFSKQILSVVGPRRLHLIDPWKHVEQYAEAHFGGLGSDGQALMDVRYERVKRELAAEIETGQVTIHRDFSSSASHEFEDSYFDWIYIDGNHLYEFVREDLEIYNPKVKAQGYLAGDDYGVEGWWANGVQKAVDEFVAIRPDLNLELIGTQFLIRVS
jgi:hypothetical protein